MIGPVELKIEDINDIKTCLIAREKSLHSYNALLFNEIYVLSGIKYHDEYNKFCGTRHNSIEYYPTIITCDKLETKDFPKVKISRTMSEAVYYFDLAKKLYELTLATKQYNRKIEQESIQELAEAQLAPIRLLTAKQTDKREETKNF